MAEVQGGCLCGEIRFIATGQPLRVGVCHCLDFRKHHGALFYAAAIFSQDAVTVQGTPAAYQGRHFCPQCGSSVFAVTGVEVELHLGALDAADEFTPSYECWTKRREAWLPDFPNVERHAQDRDG